MNAAPLPHDFDPDRVAEHIGALPAAPLVMPRQVLERQGGGLLLLRLRATALMAMLLGTWPGPDRLDRLEH